MKEMPGPIPAAGGACAKGAGNLLGFALLESQYDGENSILLSPLSLACALTGRPVPELPGITALGAMGRYVATPRKDFQPMNCAFGLIDPLQVDRDHKKIRNKAQRYEAVAARSLAWFDEHGADMNP